MIPAVYDANVLVSGLTGLRAKESVTGELIRAWARGEVDVVLSEHILSEVERTLSKPYFQRRLSQDLVTRGMLALRRRARLTRITVAVQGIASHPEDDLILATAVSGGAQYLVTGDAQLQKLRRYQKVAIVSPRSFLTELQQGSD